jgi:hypothetical protein
LAAVGCGGSGDGETATASIAKAKFIAKADAICSSVGKESQSEFAAYAKAQKIPEGKEPTTAQWAEIGEEILIPDLKRQVDEIRQLGTPAGDEAQVETFLDEIEVVIEEAEKDPATAKSPDKLLADADKKISGYGFKICGGR